MPATKQFWDSNLWAYLFIVSTDPQDVAKQSKLLSMLAATPDITISTQVINEVANVLLQKFRYDDKRVESIVDHISQSVEVQPLTLNFSKKALKLRQKYTLSWFDALIVAAALETNCDVLYTEDMQHGLVIEGKLTIQNPFIVQP
ncbi:MAG: PIN domain-containing protein [Lewinellaceae bacterium]|nr:PIN domain-containing protein [Lewinellaceae bacterium]